LNIELKGYRNMTAYASASYSLAVPMPEIASLAQLRAALDGHGPLPLVFVYGGKAIAPGYHVTEVKAARFASLDCGANPESWSETIIQLWDVAGDSSTHMSVAKFLGILVQVERRVAIDSEALLIFEAGDSESPMQVFTVGDIAATPDHVEITLAPRPATCKPRDRGLGVDASVAPLSSAKASSPCCTPTVGASKCCG
jgi:hypothetical protein